MLVGWLPDSRMPMLAGSGGRLRPEIDRAERRRAQLYRMERIPAERVAPWL